MTIITGTHRAQEREHRGWQWTWPGTIVTPVQAVPPDVTWAINRQEQPSHPGSLVRPGIQGPNVQPPGNRTWAITTLELPSHPGPFAFAGSPPTPPMQPNIRYAFTRQEETPYRVHPLPRSWFGVEPTARPGRSFGYIIG